MTDAAPRFSRDAALRQLGGDEELLAVVIASFGKQGPLLLGNAREAIASGDAVVLRRHLHSMVGSAGTLGATALQVLARELELEAEAGRVDAVRARLPEIETLLSQFLAESARW